MRSRRPDEELIKATEHLRYEYEMLKSTGFALSVRGLFGEPIVNALLEAFTVHGRNLYGFLWDEKPRSDDVVASDYFDDPDEWDKNRPKILPVLDPIRGRVGKEVAHLTYARLAITPEDKLWDIGEVLKALNSSFLEFVSRVPKIRLGHLADLIKPKGAG